MAKKSPATELQNALRDAMGKSSRDMSEMDALNAALDVAEEWKMRLSELEEEQADAE